MSKGRQFNKVIRIPLDPEKRQAADDKYHRELLTDRCLDMNTGLESTKRRRIAMDAIIARLECEPSGGDFDV